MIQIQVRQHIEMYVLPFEISDRKYKKSYFVICGIACTIEAVLLIQH